MNIKIGKIKKLSYHFIIGKIKKINLPKNTYVKLKSILGINK